MTARGQHLFALFISLKAFLTFILATAAKLILATVFLIFTYLSASYVVIAEFLSYGRILVAALCGVCPPLWRCNRGCKLKTFLSITVVLVHPG
jgi:hypothetical protein